MQIKKKFTSFTLYTYAKEIWVCMKKKVYTFVYFSLSLSLLLFKETMKHSKLMLFVKPAHQRSTLQLYPSSADARNTRTYWHSQRKEQCLWHQNFLRPPHPTNSREDEFFHVKREFSTSILHLFNSLFNERNFVLRDLSFSLLKYWPLMTCIANELQWITSCYVVIIKVIKLLLNLLFATIKFRFISTIV